MNKRPLFLGKGRGRGRGNEQQNAKPSASWNRRTTRGNAGLPPSVVKADHGPAINSEKSPGVAEVSRERMAKAEKIKESAKRFMEKAEDDLVESSEDEEVNDNEILSNTLKNYRNSSKGILIFYTRKW